MESEVVSAFFINETNTELGSETVLHKNDNSNTDECIELSDSFLHIIDELNVSLDSLILPSAVQCVYNPTIYARCPFEIYVRKYCNTPKPVMYFGMNPGPWGMSQTGVPFGHISSVRDWLGIEGKVGKPPKEIPSRPVKGFDCTRDEISGKRFWGLMKDICGTPDNFFQSSFVYNYLPVQWMKKNGCNITPGDFTKSQMEELFNICDPVLIKVLKLYEVKTIVAIGKFCETRAQKVLQKYLSGCSIKVFYMPHPSPRAVNNNNWDEKALEVLKTYGVLQYYSNQYSFT